jgi:hypothetical protein
VPDWVAEERAQLTSGTSDVGRSNPSPFRSPMPRSLYSAILVYVLLDLCVYGSNFIGLAQPPSGASSDVSSVQQSRTLEFATPTTPVPPSSAAFVNTEPRGGAAYSAALFDTPSTAAPPSRDASRSPVSERIKA